MSVRAGTPLDTSVLPELADELMRVGRRRPGFVAGTRLEASAYKLLWILSDGRARTLRELADELDLELSTINRQVNGAVRAGLLDRFAVPDSPSRPVRPTPEGTRLYEHDTAVRSGFLESVLDDMGPKAAREFVRGLRAFNDSYERLAPRRRQD